MKFNRTLSLAFLLFLSMGFPGCLSSTQTTFPHGIILISLDTLRADHLGIYGYHRNTSPYIDAFARESVIFENAAVQSAWTLPSHMSIMTSLYPSFHGVSDKTPPLADEHVTIAELILKGGYRTAAFTDGGWMRPIFGFNKGFELYKSKMVGIAKILPKVKKWLTMNKSEPFFLFIHCYDIHAPYATGKPPYDKMFYDFTYTGHLTPTNEILKAARYNTIEVNDEDVRHFIALYDGGIRYADKKIGDFLSYLKKIELYDQSLIIITSDHGEEFQEHGSFEHWQLHYRPNLHVPLIMRIPSFPKKEIRINELVQSVDIMPTILEITGLPPHHKAQGKSLLALIKGQKNFFNRILWKLYRFFKKDSNPSFAERPSHYSIINEDHQMIYNFESGSMRLFDLKSDPLAKEDVAENHNDVTELLLSKIRKVYDVKTIDKRPTVILDEKTREQLEALGYIH